MTRRTRQRCGITATPRQEGAVTMTSVSSVARNLSNPDFFTCCKKDERITETQTIAIAILSGYSSSESVVNRLR